MSIVGFNEKVNYWNSQLGSPDSTFDKAMTVSAEEMAEVSAHMENAEGDVMSGIVGLVPFPQEELDAIAAELSEYDHNPSSSHLGRLIYTYQHIGLRHLPDGLARLLKATRTIIKEDLEDKGVSTAGVQIQPKLRMGWMYKGRMQEPKAHRISHAPVFEYVFSATSSRRYPLRTIVRPGHFSSYDDPSIEGSRRLYAPPGYIAILGSNTTHESPEITPTGDEPYRLFGRSVIFPTQTEE